MTGLYFENYLRGNSHQNVIEFLANRSFKNNKQERRLQFCNAQFKTLKNSADEVSPLKLVLLICK